MQRRSIGQAKTLLGALFPNLIKNDKSLLKGVQGEIFFVFHAQGGQKMMGINLPKLDKRVPITVLTGFLGAGKTTVVRDFLFLTGGLFPLS